MLISGEWVVGTSGNSGIGAAATVLGTRVVVSLASDRFDHLAAATVLIDCGIMHGSGGL